MGTRYTNDAGPLKKGGPKVQAGDRKGGGSDGKIGTTAPVRTKSSAGKPTPREPGGELPYSSAANCVGGPVDNDYSKGSLGEGRGMNGGAHEAKLPKGKGGGLPQAKTAKSGSYPKSGNLKMGKGPNK